MSGFADLVDDFPAEYGASADAGMRAVLAALLDSYRESIELQLEGGTPSVDALHVAAAATVARIARALDVDFGNATAGSVAYGVLRRELARDVTP